MTRISTLTWPEFEEQAPRAPYWVLAVGSTEQHGPHLPLASDTLVVEKLADEVCRRDGALLLHVLGVGTLFKYADWPGGLSMPPNVLVETVVGICTMATKYRNRLLLLNGHDENHSALLIAAQRLAAEYDTDVVVVEWAELVGDVLCEVVVSRAESHAGEGLTSLLMHWWPDVVRTDLISPGKTPSGTLTRDDIHTEVRAHHIGKITRDDAPTGVLGDPTASSSATGAVLATALIDRVSGLARERGWL